MGALVLYLVFASRTDDSARYALGMMVLWLLLAGLFIRLIYGGKYEMEFILNEKGVLARTQERQAKKNRIINGLTVALGLFARRPGSAGVGLLAQSRQEVFFSWKRIAKVKYDAQEQTILLRSGWMEHIAIFCTPENYRQVEQYVQEKTAHVDQ